METGDKTAEHQEIAAVKKRNRTLVADGIDWCVSPLECLCEWHVVNFHPVIMNCRHRIVASQIGHQAEPY
jgi:hypothetical protein